ncbi:lactate dehydrogenase/glycoside hydrolase [Aspergillus nidulans var. acristatus]
MVLELLQQRPKAFKVPVIGGHSGEIILPIYSQAEPLVDLDKETLAAVIHRVQFGRDEIVKSKKGAGSATTYLAYAGSRFVKAIVAAMNGESGGQEIAQELGIAINDLKADITTGVSFMAA